LIPAFRRRVFLFDPTGNKPSYVAVDAGDKDCAALLIDRRFQLGDVLLGNFLAGSPGIRNFPLDILQVRYAVDNRFSVSLRRRLDENFLRFVHGASKVPISLRVLDRAWRTRRDSNSRPSESKSDALSS
jgi:hypothetical protein